MRIRVAAVIPWGGGLVLVRHLKDGREYHLLPGGGVEVGETLAQALAREVSEETGLAIRVERPLFLSDGIAPDGTRHIVQIVFLTEVVGGVVTEPGLDARVAASEVVPVADLDRIDLRPPMIEDLRRAAEEGFQGPARYLGPLWSPESGSGPEGAS